VSVHEEHLDMRALRLHHSGGLRPQVAIVRTLAVTTTKTCLCL
jgi:hypothetical protein